MKMEKGLVRSLEAINYRVFIGYESACSGFRLKRSNFPRHVTGGVRFFRMCVQYINVCLRKKLIAASAGRLRPLPAAVSGSGGGSR